MRAFRPDLFSYIHPPFFFFPAMNERRILAIAAHPDDIDFGCAGSLAKWVDEGHHVEELIVTDGARGKKDHAGDVEDLVKTRRNEQREAARVLGVEDVRFMGITDGELENTKELRRKLVREIRAIRPDLILSFDPANRAFRNRFVAHRDHRQLSEAVFDAASPAAGNPTFFPEQLEERLSPHLIDAFLFFATRSPDQHVDITEHIDQKMEALTCHSTQVPDREWVEETIRPRAKENASGQPFAYAETFRRLDT